MVGNMNIPAVLKLLELPIDSVNQLLNMLRKDPNNAQPYLTKFKLLVRKQRRILAKKYHPDIYRDGDKRMKQINNVVDMLLKSSIVIRQPQPVVIRSYTVYQYFSYSGFGSSTITSGVF